MRAPKILAVASAIDLDFRYGCTPLRRRLRCRLMAAAVPAAAVVGTPKVRGW